MSGTARPGKMERCPEDIKAHIEFQQALNAELASLGELVDAQGLAGPELAKFVVSDGTGAPVVTDGPDRHPVRPGRRTRSCDRG